MPQFLRYPVNAVEDFRKFWRERMRADLNARIGLQWRTQLRQHGSRDYVLVIIADRWGGVDKRALAEDRAAIDAELRRVAPLIRDGGCVPMLDHSATPNIPYANYCYFMEQLPRYL